MNGATITQMPTMCVPERLSKKELVEQYKYMEETAFNQGQMLHEVNVKLGETCIIANQLASVLWALVDSYDAGDQAAILLQIKKLSEQRSSQKAKVH